MVARPPEVLALIPARGGSKSIPRKNIRRFGNHPLIAYSVAAGLQAERIQRVIVSTDDEEIAQVALDYGAEVPFLRPPELSLDHVEDLPVFEHALQWLREQEGYVPDLVVQLRPTSPLRPRRCTDDAVEQLWHHVEADCVRTVTPSWQNPYKMWRIEGDAMISLLRGEFDEPYNMPRQALPATYWQTGHLDVIRTETITGKHSMTGDRILPYVIDPGYALDIDTEEDWEIAQWAFRHRRLKFVVPSGGGASLERVRLLAFPFNGVLADTRVRIAEDGTEVVACSRVDGMGLSLLRQQGIQVVVLGDEPHLAAEARCAKLDLPYHVAKDRAVALERLAAAAGIPLSEVAYIGQDVDDLICLRHAGLGMAVANAHPSALVAAEWVLDFSGGQGAVREACDRILEAKARMILYHA